MGRCAHGVTRRKRSYCLSAPVFLRLRVQKGKVQALGLEGGKLGSVFCFEEGLSVLSKKEETAQEGPRHWH